MSCIYAEAKHLLGYKAIIVVCYNCSDPGPIEANGKLGNGPGLVNIAGHGPEEVRILESVTQTRTASCVAHLREINNTYILKIH